MSTVPRWYHRAFDVGHGRDGFVIRVADRWWPAIVAERAVETILAALGHPCCGRGPLGRVMALQLPFHRFLNLPNKLYWSERLVATIPISDEQAVVIAPWAAEHLAGNDDEEADDA